jgi:hypothetical protein
MATTSTITPPSKELQAKVCSVTRTMTAATEIATLPKGAKLLGILMTGTASDAGTTATLSLGTASSGTAYVNALDVKTAATGTGGFFLTNASDTSAELTADTKLTATYAETGTASAAGAWTVVFLYVR